MPDKSGNVYALTILSPIRPGRLDEVAYADVVRSRLDAWNFLENSPMAKVPQTYLCRYFVLDDVFTQSLAGGDVFGPLFDFLSIFSDRARRRALPREDHLKSKYLVFSCNFHGDLDNYLRSMWLAAGNEIRHAWEFCYAFDQVRNADDFVAYMKKCRLKASLFFDGSNDDPLEEQLKALYLKQEFGKFVVEHQGLPAEQLQQAYREFIARAEPANLAGPSWHPGQYRLR
ncbi:hypothetical protein [Noviherbaspirillum sedimenti]|uniref:Uncharacterized protein n=1 Tax=Noviherbaspirillum sedimenti TaxID=2320865 RepID=A0A3A3FZX5_9BURK|nr:hypothetical protein [Noviherbaspirillum sedimenti]RJG01747.1 hypothetical protein D3878_09260 [Noviherbaspirillum sedimenti]